MGQYRLYPLIVVWILHLFFGEITSYNEISTNPLETRRLLSEVKRDSSDSSLRDSSYSASTGNVEEKQSQGLLGSILGGGGGGGENGGGAGGSTGGLLGGLTSSNGLLGGLTSSNGLLGQLSKLIGGVLNPVLGALGLSRNQLTPVVKSQCGDSCGRRASDLKSPMSNRIASRDSESGSFRKSEELGKVSDEAKSEDRGSPVDADANVLSSNVDQPLEKESTQGLKFVDKRNIVSSRSRRNVVEISSDTNIEENIKDFDRLRMKRQLGEAGSLVDANVSVLDSGQSGGNKADDDSFTPTKKKQTQLTRSSKERGVTYVEDKIMRSEGHFNVANREKIIEQEMRRTGESTSEDETVETEKIKKRIGVIKRKKSETVLSKTNENTDADNTETNYKVSRSDGIEDDKLTEGVENDGKQSHSLEIIKIDLNHNVETSEKNSKNSGESKMKNEEIIDFRNIEDEYFERKEKHTINSNEAVKKFKDDKERKEKYYVQTGQNSKKSKEHVDTRKTSEANSKNIESKEIDQMDSLESDVKKAKNLGRGMDQEGGEEIGQKSIKNEDGQEIGLNDGNKIYKEQSKKMESGEKSHTETVEQSRENVWNKNLDNVHEEDEEEETRSKSVADEEGRKLRESSGNIESKKTDSTDPATAITDSSKIGDSKEADALTSVKIDRRSDENIGEKNVSDMGGEETKDETSLKEMEKNYGRSSENEESKEIDPMDQIGKKGVNNSENHEKELNEETDFKINEVVKNKKIDPSDIVSSFEENSKEKESKEVEEIDIIKSGGVAESKDIFMNMKNKEETEEKIKENEGNGRESYLDMVKTDEERNENLESRGSHFSDSDENGEERRKSEGRKEVGDMDSLQPGDVKSKDVINKDMDYLDGGKSGEKSRINSENEELNNINMKTNKKYSEDGISNEVDPDTIKTYEVSDENIESEEIVGLGTDAKSSQKIRSQDINSKSEMKIGSKDSNPNNDKRNDDKRSCNEDSCELDDTSDGGAENKNNENDGSREFDDKVRKVPYQLSDENIGNEQIDKDNSYTVGNNFESGDTEGSRGSENKESKEIGSEIIKNNDISNSESDANSSDKKENINISHEEKADSEERTVENEDNTRKVSEITTKDTSKTFESMEVSTSEFVRESSFDSDTKEEDKSKSFALTDTIGESLEENDSSEHIPSKDSSLSLDNNSGEVSVREDENNKSGMHDFKSSVDSNSPSKSIEDSTEYPEYEDYSYFEYDFKSKNPEPTDFEEEKTDDSSIVENESKESVENTRKSKRYKHYLPFSYNQRDSFEEMYKATIRRMYWPFTYKHHRRPFYSKKRHSYNWSKRSIPPAEAKQIGMPIMQPFPYAIAGSNLYGSYASAQSRPFLGGGELGGLGAEEPVVGEVPEEIGELGRR